VYDVRNISEYEIDTSISPNVVFKVPQLLILPMNDVKKSSKDANFPKVTNFWKVLQHVNYELFQQQIRFFYIA
jgi:hypothetical protein